MNFIEIIKNILNFEILKNPISVWILAIMVYIVIFFLLKKIVKFIVRYISTTIKDKKMNFWIILLKQIEAIPKYFYIAIEIYVPLKLLAMPKMIDTIINGVFAMVMIIQAVNILNTIVVYGLKGAFTKKGKLEETTLNALKLITKIVLRAIAILLLLSNLGIEVSPLLASLGIGWIAIAFALQSILQDLFSSFSIISSRPFKVGDYISLWGDNSWTVKEISLKSTHVTTRKWYDIRIPNKEILNNTLENYGRMKHRRIRFEIWVTYDTSTKQLKKIPNMIKKVIEKEDDIMFERSKLIELGSYSINFKTSYLIQNKSYITYLEKNENILLGILELFEKEKIKIALPTQVIHTDNENIDTEEK